MVDIMHTIILAEEFGDLSPQVQATIKDAAAMVALPELDRAALGGALKWLRNAEALDVGDDTADLANTIQDYLLRQGE